MNLIKNSIGLKIFSVVSFIVLLMVGISIVNVRLQGRVGQALHRAANHYIVAYGALSRANLRSVEQAMALRGRVIARFLLKDDELQKGAKRLCAVKGQQFWDDTGHFHETIALELKEKHPFADIVSLARLDEKVNEIEAMQRKFEKNIAKYDDAVERGDWDAVAAETPAHAAWRKEFDEYMDGTRQFMLKTTQEASAEVIRLQKMLHTFSAALVVLASLIALVFAAVVTRNLVRPVRTLLEGTQSVIGGRLDVSLPVTTSDEIGHLTSAFNSMTAELHTGNRVRDMFGKYVDPQIVKDLIDKPQLLSSEGERRVMTILFCDMQGFTNLSEGLIPTTLVTLMNRYLTLMSEAIREHQGVVDKYIGDAVMAYWGVPFNRENEQARLAAQAALAMLRKLDTFRAELPELLGIRRNLPSVSMRIGIATGDAVVGNIGSDQTKNFTVIGDTVNLAARLESVNKTYGTRILVSDETASQLGDAFVTREVDTILVPGKDEAKRVFEVLGERGQVTADATALRERYAEGLAAYRAMDWEKALSAFTACALIDQGDGPSSALIKRLEQFKRNPPEQSWNGAWVIASK